MTMGEAAAATRPFPTAGPLPAGLVLRHLRPPDDYPAMNAIANAIRTAQGDNFSTTDEQFAKFYDNLSRCDPVTDVAIAEIAGQVAGYGRAAWHEELDGTRIYEVIPFVDPNVAGQHVFTAMIDAIEARARAIAADHPPATKILAAMNQAFNLDSWRTASSSTTTTMRPARISATASSTSAKTVLRGSWVISIPQPYWAEAPS